MLCYPFDVNSPVRERRATGEPTSGKYLRWIGVGGLTSLGGWIVGCSLFAFPFSEYDKQGDSTDGAIDRQLPTSEASTVDALPSCNADLQTDVHNCGACGHDCRGQPCAAGACQVTTVFNDPLAQVHAMSIALSPADPAYVFVAASSTDSANGYVKRVPKTGPGTADNLVTGIYAAYDIIVAGDDVYWSQGDGVPQNARGIGRASRKPGGGSSLLNTSVGQPDLLAADATALYWNLYDQPGLWTANRTAPANTRQLLGSSVHGLAVDDTGLYLAIGDNSGAGSITAMAKDGSGPRAIASETFPKSLALLGDQVYWGTDLKSIGVVRRASKAGGPVTDLAIGQNAPCCLAMDDRAVYFINAAPEGGIATLMRALFAGGAPLKLANVAANARSTVVDDAYVYWVEAGDVKRVAK